MENFNLKPLRVWCQKVLPLVYDDSLSYYEFLCKMCNTLNEVINNVNTLPDYIANLVSEDKLKNILSTLLDNLREQIASANEKESKTATSPRHVGDMVWVDGDLYQVIHDMIAGDQYVNNSNVKKITIADAFTATFASSTNTLSLYGLTPTGDGNISYIELLNGVLTVYDKNAHELITEVSRSLQEETTNRKNSDNALEEKINNEITERTKAVNNETTERISAVNNVETIIKTTTMKAYNTVKDMVENANAENACYVSGYYSKGDGGCGVWVISDTELSGLGTVHLNNDKYAQLITENVINPLMFGIKSNEDIGQLFELYNTNITIDLLGNTYTFNKKQEFGTNFTLQNGTINCIIDANSHDTFFSTEEGLGIKNTIFRNVTIIGTPSSDAVITWRPYLLYLKGENNLIENCHIEVLNNKAVGGTALWIRHGYTELINSVFKATSEGDEGGSLWVRAYAKVDSCTVHAENCHFENATNDECIAVWGSGAMNVTFDNCTFKTSRSRYAYTFRTFYAPIHATFNNCIFTGTAKTSVINSSDTETSGGSVYLTVNNSNFNYALEENTPFMDLRGAAAKGYAYFKFFDTQIRVNKHLISIGGSGPTFVRCYLNLGDVTDENSGSIATTGTFKDCSINAPTCHIGGTSLSYDGCTIRVKANAYCGVGELISIVRCALTSQITLHGIGENAVVNVTDNTRTVSGYTNGSIRCGTKFNGGGNVVNNMLPVGAASTWFTSGNYANNQPGIAS